MNRKILIIFFLLGIFQQALSQDRYHLLNFTSSEPIIKKRCIDFSKIASSAVGFVKETADSLNRCIKLEFYNQKGVLFTAVDLPSIVEYTWTDSSVIETLYEDFEKVFSPIDFVRPNKVEYLLKDSLIVKEKEYYNDKLVDSSTPQKRSNFFNSFFMMYSGCKPKLNEEYRLKF